MSSLSFMNANYAASCIYHSEPIKYDASTWADTKEYLLVQAQKWDESGRTWLGDRCRSEITRLDRMDSERRFMTSLD